MKFLLFFIFSILLGCATQAPKNPPRSIEEAEYEKSQYQEVGTNNLELIDRGEPYFPLSAINKNQEGWCIASHDILESGITENIQIHDCSPQNLFEKACRIQVERKRFAPNDEANVGIIHKCVYKLKH